MYILPLFYDLYKNIYHNLLYIYHINQLLFMDAL